MIDITIIRAIQGLLELDLFFAAVSTGTKGAAGRAGMSGSVGGVAFLDVLAIEVCGWGRSADALVGVTNERLGVGREIPLISLILPLLSIFVVCLKCFHYSLPSNTKTGPKRPVLDSIWWSITDSNR